MAEQMPDKAAMQAISEAFEDVDSIPPTLSAFALDALQWRMVDDELMMAAFDSSRDEVVGVRGTTQVRHAFRFEGHGVIVSVSATETSLVGSVQPPAPYAARIESPDVTVEFTCDPSGDFVLTGLHVPLRIAIDVGGRRVVSPWITG